MTRAARLAAGVFCLWLVAPADAPAKAHEATAPTGVAKVDNSARCDVNNLDFVVTNHGSVMFDLMNGGSGLFYPRGSTNTVVFAAGLWLGAKVNDSLRVTVGEYSQEFVPGPIQDGAALPDNARFKVYRITPGDTTSSDYLNWPVQDGAPLDAQGRPAVTGDLTLWCVYNDADQSVHLNGAGRSAPLGVEIQQTVFAFNQQNPLGNCAFMRYVIINKGGNQLDSMFVTFWSDPDLGGYLDDLVGCDTTRSLGYAYNSTNTDQLYATTPPAVGFDFFQGPLVPDPLNPGQMVRLPMSSFSRYTNGTDPQSAVQSYNYMRGLLADGSPYEYPAGTPVSFQLTGDPVTGAGDLDSDPSDRRMQLSSGPFQMAPGDTQEIVVGVIVGQGANRLSSVRVLQSGDDFAQAAYDLDFQIASPPPGPAVSSRAFNRKIDLIWGTQSEGNVSVNAALAQEYHFEGYDVYQSLSLGGPWERIATFDLVDSVGILYDDVFSPEKGTYERIVIQQGTNEGITNHMVITTDAIRGGKLVNNREYFFAVTAYSYDVNHTVPFEVGGSVVGHLSTYPLESGIRPLRIVPSGSSAVLFDEADHVAGNGDGEVILEYLDPRLVESKDYRVTFEENGLGALTWNLAEIGPVPQSVLTAQTKFDGDYTYPVVSGIMVRVIGVSPGAKKVVEVCGDGSETDVVYTYDTGNCSGEWYIDPLGEHTLERFTRFEPIYDASHDYEIRFVADSTEYAWDYFGRPDFYSGRFPGRVPWEVWDIGINTPNDTTDDVRITAMVFDEYDVTPDAWGWGDGIYFRNIPYASVNWSDPGLSSETYDPNDEFLGYGRFFFYRVDGATTGPQPAAGTRIRLVTKKVLAIDDVYEYHAKAPGEADGTVLTAESRIMPIPNPYYNRSTYEQNQFNRVLRFASLPPRKVTIRIFNLAGDLVRTLVRDDATEGTVDWDLLTDRGLPVASGIYFWVAEVDGAETQKGKLAVFVEKERLNTF